YIEGQCKSHNFCRGSSRMFVARQIVDRPPYRLAVHGRFEVDRTLLQDPITFTVRGDTFGTVKPTDSGKIDHSTIDYYAIAMIVTKGEEDGSPLVLTWNDDAESWDIYNAKSDGFWQHI